jgi:excisionase family DNA binding protein
MESNRRRNGLWNAAEVADFLAVKRATIYLWVKQRSIPHVVLSRGRRKNCVRFRPEQIEEWLKGREQKRSNRFQ